ncbi:NAD(P)-dependent oxidoreductase [Nocardia vinacea]|uniref:NAD(P)-dependent oxidoreductase n=1 Tax=Nocardia vinacea TaxID=96468 RepID=A0ABZ1YN91_9NOCA|nr:NAD(P)-dependent oxidoreductase [Nocardia vinacea]
MSQVIGFVGAGQMGEPMVVRLVRAGHRVVLYARRPSVRERLKSCGAEVVDSLAAVAESSDVVIVCVFSDSQLVDVLGGPEGLLAKAGPDVVIVSHTTGTVATVKDLAAAYPEGPTLLDGPVSGSAVDIAAGKLTVLLGGPVTAVDVVRPIMESYADPVVATGALGSALIVKLVNNALFAANAQLVAEAVNVGQQLGVADEELLRALSVCSARSYASNSILGAGSVRGFEHIAAPFLRKDVAACLSATAELGIDLGQLATVIADGPLELS